MRTVIHKFRDKRGKVVDVQLEVRSAKEYVEHVEQPNPEPPKKPAVKPTTIKEPDASV